MARHRDPFRRDRRLIGAGAALVATLVLGGCASAGAGAAETSMQSTSTRITGPLDEFFGGPSNRPSDEEMAAKQRQVQEAIVACMAAEGFEYLPYVQAQPDADFFAEMNTRAFAEKYGYGIVNTSFGDGVIDPSDDPNNDLSEGMSPAELDAYYSALHGPQTDTDAVTADDGEMVMPQDIGCWGDAQEQVYGTGPAMSEFDDLFDRLGRMQEQAGDDPAVAQARQEWASCMSDSGHPGYSDPEEPWQEISRRSQEYFDTAYPAPADPGAPTGTAPGPTESWTPPPPDDPALVALQRDEIDLAVGDFDCRERSGYQRALEEAQIQLEEQFVRDNRAELERFRDAVDVGGG